MGRFFMLAFCRKILYLKNMKKLILSFLLFLCACTPKAETPVGKVFRMIEPSQPMEITLSLEADGRFGGKAVNSYFGVYQINGHEIVLNLQGHTMMMAPPPQMEAENDYFKNLNEIKTFEFQNNRLILKGNQTYIFETSDTN